MDEANTVKEKVKALGDNLKAKRQLTLEKNEQLQAAKEKLKTIAAKVVEAFQQTEEYNIVLFSWYYKGFELLRRYLVKHPSGVDLENLDMEVVDQEMATDEASQSTAPIENAPRDAPLPPLDGDDAATTWTCFVFVYIYIYIYIAQYVLGLFSFYFQNNAIISS